MLKSYFWREYYTPMYLFLIEKILPLVIIVLSVIIVYLYVRWYRNKLFDIFHPEGDIRTNKTNTWYKTPEERAQIAAQRELKKIMQTVEKESEDAVQNDVE